MSLPNLNTYPAFTWRDRRDP